MRNSISFQRVVYALLLLVTLSLNSIFAQSNPTDIVLYASEAPVKKGAWRTVADSTAAGKYSIVHPNGAGVRITTPQAYPVNYFEISFLAQAGVGYRLWIRGRAQNNSTNNDTAYVQFSNTVTSSGAATYRIGTSSAITYYLEDCYECGLYGWGWQDTLRGNGANGPLIYFKTAGTQTIRIQTREDGLYIDQILLSPNTYLQTAPGTPKDDRTILSKTTVTTPPNPTDPPINTGGIWKPAVGTTWQWQLSSLPINLSYNVGMYNIDGFDNSAQIVQQIHAKGSKAVCYINAGAWEDWRPDASKYPASVKGKNLDGWPGEKWLDIRQISVLAPIIEARMDMCKQKGFDAVEPDNIDGYTNSTGFPLTYQDQLKYNIFLANAAHARGLSIALKNDLDQVKDLVNYFDFAINEQCFQYNECNLLVPFINAGKPVFNAEYQLSPSQFCSKAKALQFSSIKKNLSLDEKVEFCQ
jgi:hypothetical protein